MDVVTIDRQPFTRAMVKSRDCIYERGQYLNSYEMPASQCDGCEFKKNDRECRYELREIQYARTTSEYTDLDGDIETVYYFQITCTSCGEIIQLASGSPIAFYSHNKTMRCKKCGTPHVYMNKGKTPKESYMFAIPVVEK